MKKDTCGVGHWNICLAKWKNRGTATRIDHVFLKMFLKSASFRPPELRPSTDEMIWKWKNFENKSSDYFNYPKKSLLLIKAPKKILAKISFPQKIPEWKTLPSKKVVFSFNLAFS